MKAGGLHRQASASTKARLKLVVFVAMVGSILLLLSSGSSFHVEEATTEKKGSGTYKIPRDADLTGKDSLQDVVESSSSSSKKKSSHGTSSDLELLKHFIDDPSIPARCPETAAPSLPTCDAYLVDRTELSELPALMVPFSVGQTTKGMTLKAATEVLKNPSIVHHPIFAIYANHTATSVTNKHRVLEFNGVHTEYDFDCEANVDFRLYHQCRAALCTEHERRLAEVPATESTVGQYPLVDEEYMEYVMTLTTAHEAARSGSPYTFIELGARYGTWIVRAGVSFKSFDPVGKLNLLAVEGNCKWFRKMDEHVRCNKLQQDAHLILSYAAPRSYNKVEVGKPSTYKEARAVSLLDMLPGYKFVDMIDFDIQGFEWLTIEESGVLELMTEKIGFAHFGTHSTEIEKRVVTAMQQHGWCVIYFYAGAHTKKLDRGHRCETPFGPSVFNDGVLGLANLKYYPNLKGKCQAVSLGNLKAVAKTCYHKLDAVTTILERNPEVHIQ